MDNISQFGKFEDGVAAGKRLLNLFKQLGDDVEDMAPPESSELETFFNYLWQQNTFQRRFPGVEGFFSTILKRDGYQTEILEVWGSRSIISEQEEWAPVCNFTEKTGIIQFGSWTGDYSDGDAWCLDIRGECVICVPVGSPETRQDALDSAYGVLPDFHYFEAYLRRSCEMRGWFDE